MVSSRIMTAPITTATWAAVVMLRPVVAVTNCARPGKVAGLVIGQRYSRRRKIVDLAKVCKKARFVQRQDLYKRKAFIRDAGPHSPTRCPDGAGASTPPRVARVCKNRGYPTLYHRRARPELSASVNSRPRLTPMGASGKFSENSPNSGQMLLFRRISEAFADPILQVPVCLPPRLIKSGWSRWILLISPSM